MPSAKKPAKGQGAVALVNGAASSAAAVPSVIGSTSAGLGGEMIGKQRRATLFKAEFPTLPAISVQPKEVQLHQKNTHHDVLVLTYHSTSSKNFKLLKTGVPVKFSWKQGGRKAEWLGYVSSVGRTVGAEKNKDMSITCVSSSYVLKQRVAKTYTNKTIPEVVAQIAKDNKFRFVGENHTRRFSGLSAGGSSIWEWLHELASRIGYVAYVSGTDLIFRPFDKLLDEASADVPIFQMWATHIPRTLHQIDRTLDRIVLTQGDNIEDGSASRSNKIVSGIHPVTGKPFTANKSPKQVGKGLRTAVNDVLFDDYRTDQIVHDKLTAMGAAEGSAHMARFNMPAKIWGQGDPRVRPNHLVYIDGTGTDTNGYWLVRSVIHKFVYGGLYDVEATIVTDGTAANRKSATRRSDGAAAGKINLEGILTRSTAFGGSAAGKNKKGMGFTVNLATEFGSSVPGPGGASSARATSSGSSKLAQRTPLLTNSNKQGFIKTPTKWESTSPSSRTPTRAGGQ